MRIESFRKSWNSNKPLVGRTRLYLEFRWDFLSAETKWETFGDRSCWLIQKKKNAYNFSDQNKIGLLLSPQIVIVSTFATIIKKHHKIRGVKILPARAYLWWLIWWIMGSWLGSVVYLFFIGIGFLPSFFLPGSFPLIRWPSTLFHLPFSARLNVKAGASSYVTRNYRELLKSLIFMRSHSISSSFDRYDAVEFIRIYNYSFTEKPKKDQFDAESKVNSVNKFPRIRTFSQIENSQSLFADDYCIMWSVKKCRKKQKKLPRRDQRSEVMKRYFALFCNFIPQFFILFSSFSSFQIQSNSQEFQIWEKMFVSVRGF